MILAIETSCDETSAAVTDGKKVLSNIVATQVSEHRKYGGVVPEIASRRHIEAISAVCERAIKEAGVTYGETEAVAVTYAPGLIGALLVGVNFAKGLAMSLNVPLVPVHHLRGHIAANYITSPDLRPPFLCLLVSGGNTLLTAVNDYTSFDIIGETLDDAAGECLDKTARVMGLPYPGGISMDGIADPKGAGMFALPRPNTANPFDFSFSGLKTAVINIVHNARAKGGEPDVPMLCGAVRHTVCEILTERTMRAAKERKIKNLALAGGVAANSELRKMMSAGANALGINLYLPDIKYCGDNAAMIGVQAAFELAAGHTAGSDLNAVATMPVTRG